MIDGIMDKSTNQTEFGIIVNDSNMQHSNYPNFGENSELNLERQNYMSVVASLITCHSCVCHVLMNEKTKQKSKFDVTHMCVIIG